MALKAGTLANWSDSMAALMDQAFALEWQAVKGVPLPGTNRQDMQILLSAIAQGIVKHLDAKQSSFIINGADTTESINIDIDTSALRPPLNTEI